MFKLSYPSNSARWPNDLQFSSWAEYWKTLGYLSNPNIHKHYEKGGEYFTNKNFDMNIKYEYNSKTNSYSDTGRIGYYGNSKSELWFSKNLSELFSIKTGGSGNTVFRINRKELVETLENDLKFIRIKDPISSASRDEIVIPKEGELALSFAKQHKKFDFNSWEQGWNLV